MMIRSQKYGQGWIAKDDPGERRADRPGTSAATRAWLGSPHVIGYLLDAASSRERVPSMLVMVNRPIRTIADTP